MLELVAEENHLTLSEAANLLLDEKLRTSREKMDIGPPQEGERRRSPRKWVSYPAVVNAKSPEGAAFSKGFIRDCSLGGVRVQLQNLEEEEKQVFAQAREFEVVFTGRDSSEYVYLTCESRRVEEQGGVYMAGEVRPQDRQSLQKLERFARH
jgi:hypothetical protein